MAVPSKSGRTGLAATGIMMLIIMMLVTRASADSSADSRLIFDPGAMERSRLGSDPAPSRPPVAKPSGERPAAGTQPGWTSNPLQLPSFEDTSLRAGLATGLSASKNPAAETGANLFDQRVTFGNLSIGLETETSIKQRSLSGDGDKDPERDTVLDQKRPRGFLPFIGLSAKSPLQ
jgi:hypothetical protein